MPGKIEETLKGNFLTITMTGETDAELLKHHFARLREILARPPADLRILYDCGGVTSAKMEEAMTYRSFMNEFMEPHVVKGAAIISKPFLAFLAKIVMALSKKQKIYYVEDRDKALKWLME